MNVLIVGGYSVFVSQLIEKFNKEGWEVYLLSGNKNPSRRHPYVFEQYDFRYDTDSIKEILDSASPDLVVFTGAYDSNLSSGKTRRESMYYMSSLVNVLMACQMLHVPRFVYISSHEVYEESYTEPITEEQPASPVSTKGMLVAQGENLVIRYGETTDMDTIVLRLDHMYWMPKNRKEVGEIHAKLCLYALRDRKIPASEKHIFSSVYISDAVFAVYEVSGRPEHQHRIYQITTGEEENEIRVAQIIQAVSARSVTIRDNTVGLTRKNIMSGQRLREEFGLGTRFSYEERVRSIMEYMDRNRNDFLRREEREGSWLQRMFRRFEKVIFALIPFIENLVVFLFVFMLNNRTADSDYFRRVDVFLLYVVLFAVFYGKRQAIVAAFLSTAGFIFRQAYFRTAIEVLVDYNIYIWMAQLFIVGMAVGHLRDSLKIITDDKDEEIAFLTGQLDDIYDINSSNLKVKNILEDHIVSYDDSLGVLQNMTESLEHLNPGEAMYQAAEVLSKVIGTDDVAIYKVSNRDYCRLLVGTTDQARQLGKSLKYSDRKELDECLEKREVFVNRDLSKEMPVMAYGLRHGDDLEYIIMVWNLPYEKMSLHQMNLLKVVGYMIQNAITRADTYLDAVRDKRYLGDTNILNTEAFEKVVKTSTEIRRRDYAESVLLWVQSAGDAETLQKDENELQRYNNILSKNVRETDSFGVGKDGHIYVLLANSNAEEADIVIRRFASQGVVCSLKESM